MNHRSLTAAMLTQTFLALALVISVASAFPASAASKIVLSKYTPEKGGLLSELGDLPQITHLPVGLFIETNSIFDRKLCESVRSTAKPPIVISFCLVTFVFTSPNTNTPVYSFCEMGQ